jgi:hypothetical protein
MLLSGSVFILKIKDEEVNRIEGELKKGRVSDFSDLVKKTGIKKGYIYGVKKYNQVGLGFSPSFPKKYRQQFRNVWHASKF